MYIVYFHTGSGLGDPHYRTFDNFHYNFQGQGEFTLLELYQAGETDPVFSIQGHLGYPADWKDRGVTGHLGLAFGDPNFAFHVSHISVILTKTVIACDLINYRAIYL